jgi:hypothetical protein
LNEKFLNKAFTTTQSAQQAAAEAAAAQQAAQAPFVNQNQVQGEFDPMFYQSYIGATEGYRPWLEQTGEGARRIGSWAMGAAGAINGLGMSSGYGDMPTGPYTTQAMVDQMLVNVMPQLDEDELARLKVRIESQGFNTKLMINVDDAAAIQAKENLKSPTWSYHTIYTTSRGSAANYEKIIPSNFPGFDVGTKIGLRGFADGGYTGSYGGLATVHPNELILNAAQQRNVAGEIGSNSGRILNINIDARGATITDSSMDTLVAKIKSALQDESYR